MGTRFTQCRISRCPILPETGERSAARAGEQPGERAHIRFFLDSAGAIDHLPRELVAENRLSLRQEFFRDIGPCHRVARIALGVRHLAVKHAAPRLHFDRRATRTLPD